MNDLIKISIHDIALSENGFIILLKPESIDYENSALLILVGFSEAQFLTIQFNKIPTNRPLMIDVVDNLLEQLNVTLKKVVIYHVVEKTFYAKMYFQKDGEDFYLLESRASDALIFALKFNVEVYIDEEVLVQRSVPFQFNEETEMELVEYKQSRLKKLKEELEKSVATEQYENAARIRDEIKKIQGEVH